MIYLSNQSEMRQNIIKVKLIEGLNQKIDRIDIDKNVNVEALLILIGFSFY